MPVEFHSAFINEENFQKRYNALSAVPFQIVFSLYSFLFTTKILQKSYKKPNIKYLLKTVISNRMSKHACTDIKVDVNSIHEI